MSSTELLIVASIACVGLFALARRLEPIARTLVRIQAVYWFISYVVRPAVLLAVQPHPQFGDPIADPRLALGGYDTSVAAVLHPVVVGLLAYDGLIFAVGYLSRRHRLPGSVGRATADFRLSANGIWICFLIIWAIRIAWLSGITNNFVSTLLGLGPIFLGGIVVAILTGSAHAKFAIIAIFGSEILWSILYASKSPLSSIIVAVLIGLAMGGYRFTARRLLVLVCLAPLGALIFGYLQGVKETSATSSALASVQEAYPAAVQPLLPIVRRFDLFQAVTDAVDAEGRWLSPGQVVGRALGSLIPSELQSSKIGSGVAWAREVRSQTLATDPNVSLADGPIAEGFVVAGYRGVVVESVVLILAVLSCARLIRSGSVFFQATGLYIGLGSFLFERGALGLADGVSKAWQVALAAAIIVGLFHIRAARRPESLMRTVANRGLVKRGAVIHTGEEV